MSLLRRVFPVVHHLDDATTLAQAQLALTLGADGVFLISHQGNDAALIPLGQTLQAAFLDRRIGMNFLGDSAVHAVARLQGTGLTTLWVDHPGITSRGANTEGQALLAAARTAGIEVWASVAFKYQAPEPLPGVAAQAAIAWGTLPVTSGPGTGQAPSVDQVRMMREALGAQDRLAVASGMTPEHIEAFLPYVTDVLVATGVSVDDHHFDPVRLEALLAQVAAFNAHLRAA